MSSIKYHLKELDIALDQSSDQRILPHLSQRDEDLLDVGCGIGQSFVALNCFDRNCHGVDVDKEALAYGEDHFGKNIHYQYATAENLPFDDNSMDLAFSRVSLPYTNIPKSISEIARVVRQEGRIWLTLHDKQMALKYFNQSIKRFWNIKRLLHVMYILANGYCFKYFGVLFPFVNGKYESWQDPDRMLSVLRSAGFEAHVHKRGRHQIIEGRLKHACETKTQHAQLTASAVQRSTDRENSNC